MAGSALPDRAANAKAGCAMMDRMMDGVGGMWGMGVGGAVGILLLLLVVAALVKYVFFR